MTIATAFITSAAKHAHLWLREIAYNDMACQASNWIPKETRAERQTRESQPIKLNFGVPKKHRLAWIQRTVQHLPS